MNIPIQARAPIPWSGIELTYRSTQVPVSTLAQHFGLSLGLLHERIQQHGWSRDTVTKAGVMKEQQPLSEQIKEMMAAELASLRGSKSRIAGDDGRKQRLQRLDILARILARVAAFEDGKHNAEHSKSGEPDIADDAWRLELARRLEGLRRQQELEQAAQDTSSA